MLTYNDLRAMRASVRRDQNVQSKAGHVDSVNMLNDLLEKLTKEITALQAGMN